MTIIPAYIQASRQDLTKPGTLLRFRNGDYTHGMVVGHHEGKLIVFSGMSRSEVLNCNGEEECLLLGQEEFEMLEPVYDGNVSPPSRVVSIEAQNKPNPKKYDPSQPGQYFYIERPIEEAPHAPAPTDESALPEFLYQQKLPTQPGQKPVMPKLRSDLEDPAQMSKALAIHIYQLEELHKITKEFASGVNAAMDYARRGEEQVEYRGQPTELKQLAPMVHRDPAGHFDQPEKRQDWVKAQKALVLLDKIRSGLETSGLMIVQFRNVVFELKKNTDLFTIYSQHKEKSSVLGYRDWVLTYEEFAREWSLRLVRERRQIQDAASALQKAWQRYRVKVALQVQRLLVRYAQANDDGFDQLEILKNEIDEFVIDIQEITSAYDDYSEWLDKLYESMPKEYELAQPMLVAASLKQRSMDMIYYVERFNDADPIHVNCGLLSSRDGSKLNLINVDGSSIQVDEGMMVTAQAERIRRKKRTPTVIPIEKVQEVDSPEIEDLLTPVEAPVPPKKAPQKQPTRKPKAPPSGLMPVETAPQNIPAEPVKPQTVNIKGRPVPVIDPDELVQTKQPPPPTRILPPIPTPVEHEPVDFADIPEEEWKVLSIPEKIRMAAVFRRVVLMEYMKITPPEDGVQKSYLLEIYSYRVKKPKRTGGSPVWYLYGYDINDQHIKAFILKRIKGIEILDEKFEPRWEVEFAFNEQWNKYRRPKRRKPQTEVERTDQPFWE